MHKPMRVRAAMRVALRAVQSEIAATASLGRIAAGTASEGYAGGYRDALDDVLLLMNGVTPNRRDYWTFINEQKVRPDER